MQYLGWCRLKESNLFLLVTKQLLFRMSYAGRAGGASTFGTIMPRRFLGASADAPPASSNPHC